MTKGISLGENGCKEEYGQSQHDQLGCHTGHILALKQTPVNPCKSKRGVIEGNTKGATNYKKERWPNALADGFQHYPGYQHKSANKFQVHYSSNFFAGSGTTIAENRFDSSTNQHGRLMENGAELKDEDGGNRARLIVAQK